MFSTLFADRTTQKHVLNSQSGQIAVIVLLVMAVTLVVATQLAQQTVEDVAISTENTETTRVFNAAESAAEEALARLEAGESAEQISQALENNEDLNNLFNPATRTSDTAVTAEVTEVNEFDSFVHVGTSVTLATPGSPGNARIFWDRTGNNGAVLIAVYNDEGGTIQVEYYAVRSHNPAGLGPEFLSSLNPALGSPAENGETYISKYEIPYAANTTMIRVMPLYSDTHVFVSGLGVPQGHVITGTASDSVGSQSRTIELVRGLKAAPSVMTYGVFSGGTLSK